ncbi:flagellar biosynthesis protein : Flagellar biosynthetic protein FlhB OS=Deferribacter desulfuricans (strain DSM 14783 / JCM 11476 / NBRC 101012 / SSM1) GN=flhB PE=4 SV=1: Bac_export_2 [Gemmata massiliana]|uniref:Flagellar biosynthetic protein FlhB n=1 Tax=Gemmata massiliana TaxID=1210884 RepID=A0A6P2D8B3_9BACT|nr:flagellar biosynthesis protein FlhB [Gemmata massiliana]VTR96374.1 flagellar biosynthesis protein : Flagellar biosynthetic protein FlhB OS=Deferribacter desulfuricans (strain DSM 14783 / JCM 11476 / NBRC 101012 / SSM1) GN=flhB PE=4 SV=1: Bac_export_2 [Gemmata massiliana]
MADEVDDESKTEDPTPRRREEARRQGQVPFSAELVGSLVLIVGVVGLSNLGPDVWNALINIFRHDLPRAFRPDFNIEVAVELLSRTGLRALAALLPFFGLLLAVGVAASIAQVGFQINTEKLELNFDKLNPANGLSRLFSTSALVRGLLTILKVIALGVVAYVVLNGRGGLIGSLGQGRVAGAAPAAWAVVMKLALYLAGAVALVAVFDYAYQRYRFEVSIRMTKEELKQELKQEDGDPMVKARIRQIARERTKQKMLKEVPKATVVVTNPTHYAVALRYDANRDSAPVVIAKGKGAFAKRIAKLARDSGVPVLERPPLARALQSIREGQPIPGVLFRAVAEVLAFVMKLRSGAV